MRTRATATTVALLAVLAGGCARDEGGSVPGPSRSGPAAPVVQDRWESCEVASPVADDNWHKASQEGLTLPLLGDEFQPVSAVVCRTGVHKRSAGGTEMIAEEVRADDLTALLAALRLPDEAAITDQVCTADLPGVPWVALLDREGRWVRPGIPVDSCMKPRAEFRRAYDALVTVPVKSRVIRQLESDEAGSAGCSQTYGDMTWAGGGVENVREADLPPVPASTSVKRCVYDVPVEERGGGKPAGGFRDGGPVTAADWTAMRAEIESSAAGSAACDTPASRFAVLFLEPGGTVNVEADGCRRVLLEVGDGPGVYRQSTERLTTLIFG
ncbi:hypothetical protein [Actinoplanes subglobosus]|uniref:Lipoprotein n=1 Tax=Actinoplanes subglobosus TaxID=1547892 RepID=A0ABV8IU33_9ACTN